MCPSNVDGMCGPAMVRNMHKRRLEAAKKLPLWKRILFWLPIKRRTYLRAGKDIQALDQHARLKAFGQHGVIFIEL
jgi:hypothetical protein